MRPGPRRSERASNGSARRLAANACASPRTQSGAPAARSRGVRVAVVEREVFTNLSVPVMTRLRMPEREVLDTLVGAGVARSRSDALGWCVRLVGDHQSDWIQQLQDALVAVRDARASGPTPGSPD